MSPSTGCKRPHSPKPGSPGAKGDPEPKRRAMDVNEQAAISRNFTPNMRRHAYSPSSHTDWMPSGAVRGTQIDNCRTERRATSTKHRQHRPAPQNIIDARHKQQTGRPKNGGLESSDLKKGGLKNDEHQEGDLEDGEIPQTVQTGFSHHHDYESCSPDTKALRRDHITKIKNISDVSHPQALIPLRPRHVFPADPRNASCSLLEPTLELSYLVGRDLNRAHRLMNRAVNSRPYETKAPLCHEHIRRVVRFGHEENLRTRQRRGQEEPVSGTRGGTKALTSTAAPTARPTLEGGLVRFEACLITAQTATQYWTTDRVEAQPHGPVPAAPPPGPKASALKAKAPAAGGDFGHDKAGLEVVKKATASDKTGPGKAGPNVVKNPIATDKACHSKSRLTASTPATEKATTAADAGHGKLVSKRASPLFP
ncbi:hypothetical protein B0A55_03521 [Friedmanniomyces simplex]|uniref:Uncharacterized protein n=1 Tax=Friedmanniomyces simplex TaxID=329884 RepID=A0A4U0XJI0_9PEZI|nr:hypothetical protein B0A55_03521 [Friedmanniomyces simplex]